MRKLPLPTLPLIALMGVAALSAACNDDGMSPRDQFLVGGWLGEAVSVGSTTETPTYQFALTFEQDERNVQGGGQIRVPPGSLNEPDTVNVTAEGRFNEPDLTFSVSAEGFAPVVFNGRIFRADSPSRDSVAGLLSGSALDGKRLVLRRVQP